MRFSSKKCIVFCSGLMLLLSINFGYSQNRSTLYKLRDGNRWEGVKLPGKNYKEVAGQIELVSLLLYDKNWRLENDISFDDSISIRFFGDLGKTLNVSVFNRRERYYMDLLPANITKGLVNTFSWPSSVLKDIQLPINQLSAIVKTKRNEDWEYLPVYFGDINTPNDKLTLEFTFFPKEPMSFDLNLTSEGGKQTLQSWADIRLEKDQFKTLKVEVNLNNTNASAYKLIVTENTATKTTHQFLIIFKKT